MSKIAWGSPGEKTYEAGLDRGVLFPHNGLNKGLPWNGLVSIREGTSGGEHESYYFNGEKYYDRVSPEEPEFSIQAFTYPEEFEAALGYHSRRGLYTGGQIRQPFSFAYRTGAGSDVADHSKQSKIHIVYDAVVLPHSVERSSVDTSPSPNLFNFELSTSPVRVKDRRFSAHLVIDSRNTDPILFQAIERVIYGLGGSDPFLPRPNQIVDIFEEFQPTGYGYGPYGSGTYGHGDEDSKFNRWLADGTFAEGMKHWNHTQSGQGYPVEEHDGVGPAFCFPGIFGVNTAIDTPILMGNIARFSMQIIAEVWVAENGVRPGLLEVVRNNNNGSLGTFIQPAAGALSAGWNRLESVVRNYNFSPSIEPPGLRLQIRQVTVAERNLAYWRVPQIIINQS